jgi:glycosyltransferase involved in cell wall biosynthesis
MKLFHVIVALHPPGGAELMMARLALHQRDYQGMEPVVVALGETGPLGERLVSAGIEVRSLGLRGVAGIVPAVLRLSRMIAREKPAVVQTWMYHADLVGGLAARLAGHRAILWGIRNTDVFQGAGVSGSLGAVVRLCARLSSRVPSAIVCVAEAARASHIRMGYAPGKMVVVPNGFAVPDVPDPAARAAARAALGIPAEALVVGSVGRFNPYKDQHSFVRAMGEVAAALPRARFVLAGREIGPENALLAEWIAESGHAERFLLLGHQGDIGRCFAAMDIFCLHSKSEGFPNVLAEAMLAGVASVATDVGDARLLAGGWADIVPPQDPPALAAAVLRLAALDPAPREAYGAAGRAHVAAAYGLPRVAEAYRGLYRRVLGGESLASFGLN